MHRTFVFLK